MKNTNHYQDHIALITGASGGIGTEIARKLAAEGMHVILVARREAILVDLAQKIINTGGQATVMTADLSIEVERKRIYNEVLARFGHLDILVNNAGFGWYGYTQEMPWPLALDMLRVNIAALVQFTLLFLPAMRNRNSGHIINIGSVAGSIPSQGVALYSATKAFINSFTTSLYRELSTSRVKVSVVRAGPVTTEFFRTLNKNQSKLLNLVERLGVSPQRIAGSVWHLILNPRRRIYVPGWMSVVPLIEFAFGWIMDRIGPLDLKRQAT
ncbi:MAG: SDR family oxidoreductase [Anaerolineaceae bacterium]|nr:SDR family oxidoreductase [Anaerolineaceae bacterium]MBN2678299.1 SDR family oxidoreductase [Anaerolineaceae bacterium]